jgi:putative transposase
LDQRVRGVSGLYRSVPSAILTAYAASHINMPNQVAAAQQHFRFRSTPATRRKRMHGGARDGAGRKRTLPGRPRVPHRAREITKARFPVHVTCRLRSDVPRLRNFALCAVLRRAFVYGCKKGEFRICQFSIQGNHIHLMCEAASNAALASGIQGWSIRVARGINKHCNRTGKVFEDRYHVEIVRTPKQCRAALCYVLQNARRHGVRLDSAFHGMDPFSSAWWFDGWTNPRWRDGLGPPELRTVADPQTWLLRVGWRRHGLIAIDEVPPAAAREAGP